MNLLIHVLAWLVLVPLLMADDRPQWGEAWSRNMISQEKGLAESFDPVSGQNIKWVARLGTETYSTPVIAEGKVFIGTNNEAPRNGKHQGDRGVLMCFDEKTGRFLWQLIVPKITTSIYWDWPHAGICSPVTADNHLLYVVSNRGEVLCLDPQGMANGNDGPFQDEARHAVPDGMDPIPVSLEDADILWSFDMIKECAVRQHDSAHGSILVHGSYLYVNTSNGVDDSHRKITSPQAPSLIVLNKNTGQLVAMDGLNIGPRIFHSTWSSPSMGLVNGLPQIFFAGGDGIVYSFEPYAGIMASVGTQRQKTDRTGLSANTRLPEKLRKIRQFDGDPEGPKENVHQYIGNRQEGPSNIKSVPVFLRNRLYVTLGGDLWWGKNRSWLQCISMDPDGNRDSLSLVWSHPLERHSMCTPAISNNLIFVGDSGRKIRCLDAESGKEYWIHEVKGEVWASPLAADGKAYFGTQGGELLVLAASREKKVLFEINLGAPISSSPVAANGVLYIASGTHLYAIQKGWSSQTRIR